MDILKLFVAVLAGFLNAYGLENVPGWAGLPPLAKKSIVALAAVLAPIGLEYLRSLCSPSGQCGPTFEASVGQVIIDGIIAWLVSQFAHGTNPLRKR